MPVAHQDSNKKNKHRAISLPEEVSLFPFCLEVRGRMCGVCCVFGNQDMMGREFRTECGQRGWGQLLSGQSQLSALSTGFRHHVFAS